MQRYRAIGADPVETLDRVVKTRQRAAEGVVDLFNITLAGMAPKKGQVPESILKKRKRDEDWAAKKAAAVADRKKHSKTARKDIFKRAEQYVKEYRDQVSRGACWLFRQSHI